MLTEGQEPIKTGNPTQFRAEWMMGYSGGRILPDEEIHHTGDVIPLSGDLILLTGGPILLSEGRIQEESGEV